MAQNLSHARDPRADNPQFRRRFPARCDSRRLEKGKKMGERKLTPRVALSRGSSSGRSALKNLKPEEVF